MKILDANIFIYAPQPAFAHLRPLLIDPESVVSAITKLEVLGSIGFRLMTKPTMKRFFAELPAMP